jgi:fibro-slime domain-containing protein
MNLGLPIRVLEDGNEEFPITADDDTFVFMGNRLVIDMGGVHSATTGRFRITKDGEVYAGVDGEGLGYTGVNLERENGAIIRIFHADRNSSESVFKMEIRGMVLNLTEATLARTEAIVAYDPMNPGYVAPLGESSTVGPNLERIFAIAVSTQGLILGLLAICLAVVISLVVRYLRRARNQEE